MTEVLMIAAPASGQGKTVITAAVLALLRARGVAVAAAKVGPDYIDPAFHAAASRREVVNLDPWAMSRAELAARLARAAEGAEMLIIEGVMGLFDGAVRQMPKAVRAANACDISPAKAPEKAAIPDPAALADTGSSADLAAMFGIPVLLVVDAARSGPSVAALLHGFASLRKDVRVAGVILNRLGSARHGEHLTHVIERVTGLDVVGRFPRDDALALPSRHLGLVPAGEHDELRGWLERAAEIAAESVALCRLANLTRRLEVSSDTSPRLPPLGQRVAVARDEAFCFVYAHQLMDWRRAGAEISFFSPLADEAPEEAADAVFLPGGYPELHGARLAVAESFKRGMREAAARGALIYGECGGYMALGRGLVDAEGREHAMCGLLPLATSFAEKRLHLGYRALAHDGALPWPAALRGHEFHYATTVWRGDAAPLFTARDAAGRELAPMGLRVNRVMGSFAHVISAAPEAVCGEPGA